MTVQVWYRALQHRGCFVRNGRSAARRRARAGPTSACRGWV